MQQQLMAISKDIDYCSRSSTLGLRQKIEGVSMFHVTPCSNLYCFCQPKMANLGSAGKWACTILSISYSLSCLFTSVMGLCLPAPNAPTISYWPPKLPLQQITCRGCRVSNSCPDPGFRMIANANSGFLFLACDVLRTSVVLEDCSVVCSL